MYIWQDWRCNWPHGGRLWPRVSHIPSERPFIRTIRRTKPARKCSCHVNVASAKSIGSLLARAPLALLQIDLQLDLEENPQRPRAALLRLYMCEVSSTCDLMLRCSTPAETLLTRQRTLPSPALAMAEVDAFYSPLYLEVGVFLGRDILLCFEGYDAPTLDLNAKLKHLHKTPLSPPAYRC